MTTGTIARLKHDKGFGFITGPDGQDYFFHRNSVFGVRRFEELVPGDPVAFETEPSDRGPRAGRVQVL